MATVLKLNLNDLTHQFLNELSEKWGQSAEVEIRVNHKKKKKELFSETEFWKVISSFDWHQKDKNGVIAPAIMLLEQMPLVNLYLFSDRLSEKLYNLDTRQHGEAYLKKLEDDYFSVDDFLYARCAVVAEGKDYYEKILQNPALMPADISFEPLLFIADAAFTAQKGQSFDYQPAYNFETYSNKSGWQI